MPAESLSCGSRDTPPPSSASWTASELKGHYEQSHLKPRLGAPISKWTYHGRDLPPPLHHFHHDDFILGHLWTSRRHENKTRFFDSYCLTLDPPFPSTRLRNMMYKNFDSHPDHL